MKKQNFYGGEFFLLSKNKVPIEYNSKFNYKEAQSLVLITLKSKLQYQENFTYFVGYKKALSNLFSSHKKKIPHDKNLFFITK